MKKFKILVIEMLLKHNVIAKHGDIVNEKMLASPSKDLVSKGFIAVATKAEIEADASKKEQEQKTTQTEKEDSKDENLDLDKNKEKDSDSKE